MIKPQKSNLIFKYHLTFSTYRSHKSLLDLISIHFGNNDTYHLEAVYFRMGIYFLVQYLDRSDLSLSTRFFLCKTDSDFKIFSVLYTSPDYAYQKYGQTEIDECNGQIAFIVFQSNLQIIDIQRRIVLLDQRDDDFTGGCYHCKNGQFVSLKQLPSEKRSRILTLKIADGQVTKTVFYINNAHVNLVGLVDNVVLYLSWEDGQQGTKEEVVYHGIGYYDGKYIEKKTAKIMSKKVERYWRDKQSAYYVNFGYPMPNSLNIHQPETKKQIMMTIPELISKNEYLHDELCKNGFELCRGLSYEKQIYFVFAQKINRTACEIEEGYSQYENGHIFRYDMDKDTLSYMGYLEGPGAEYLEILRPGRKNRDYE